MGLLECLNSLLCVVNGPVSLRLILSLNVNLPFLEDRENEQVCLPLMVK